MNQQEREEVAQQVVAELCDQEEPKDSLDPDQAQTELERLRALVESQRVEIATFQQAEDKRLRKSIKKAKMR